MFSNSKFSRRAGAVLGFGLGAIMVTAALTAAAPASAVSSSDFQAGTIISDVVMFNKSTMSAASIQSFLDSKAGTCHSGDTCLNTYHMDTTDYKVPTTKNKDGSYKYTQGVCLPYKGAKNESAATIIYKVAQYCGVNPQAIIVTLQKEESLVTGTTPTSLTYRKAMGYGCPDTASCNSDFYGFFKQVYWGTRAFVRPVSAYKPNVKSAILYNPKSSCGTKSVTVTDKATSNLYTYTPYTPNKAALAKVTGSGSGDSCSSYGNANFWSYFNKWFGSTVIPEQSLQFVQAIFQDVLGRAPSTADQYKQGQYLIAHSSRTGFATKITGGTEALKDYILTEYQSVLKRTPTSTESAAMLKKLTSGKLSESAVVPTLLSSTEYYRTTGATVDPFITDLYQYVLGRVPTDVELAAGEKALTKVSPTTRYALAKTVWGGSEHRTILATGIDPLYLARPATPTDITTLSAYIGKHGYFATIDYVLGSSEYYANAATRFPLLDAG